MQQGWNEEEGHIISYYKKSLLRNMYIVLSLTDSV